MAIKNTFIFCLICLGQVLLAQQLPYQTMFRQFQPLINPASVSSDYFLYEYNASLVTSYRTQWINQAETPRTAFLSGEYISNFGNAFELVAGASILQDRNGPEGVTGIYGRFGTLFSDDPYYGALSVGFNFGMTDYRISANRITWKDVDDPNIPLFDFSSNQPVLGLGAFYYKRLESGALEGDNFFAGISAPQLVNQRSLVIVNTNEVSIQRVPHFYATAGWYHFFNEDFFIETSMWAKYVKGSPLNIDFSARLNPIRTLWVGAGFNINGLVHLEAGLNIPGLFMEDGNLKLGYAFDYNIAAYGLNFGTSHEITLAYLFDTY